MDTDINNVLEGFLDCPQLKGFVKEVGIWELKLPQQTVKIKVTYDYKTKYYSYAASHYFQGPTDDRPTIPREIIDDTSDGILKRAVRIILSVYNKEYVGGNWVVNKDF